MMYDKLRKCLSSIREKTDFKPEIGLILGSGLGDYADGIKVETFVQYAEIEGFPVSTVKGHKGRFVFGYVGETPVVIMQGRVHYYEGYDMSDVVLPTRLMGMMGAKKIILTNAAGGINETFSPGDFMMITDHISTHVPSPLKEGVYIQLTGPNYETPAEIRMCRILGGDAVGMSTACEAMAARHMGLEVCGISCITNMAAGVSDRPLDHQEVQEIADKVSGEFKKLITAVIENMK